MQCQKIKALTHTIKKTVSVKKKDTYTYNRERNTGHTRKAPNMLYFYTMRQLRRLIVSS